MICKTQMKLKTVCKWKKADKEHLLYNYIYEEYWSPAKLQTERQVPNRTGKWRMGIIAKLQKYCLDEIQES